MEGCQEWLEGILKGKRAKQYDISIIHKKCALYLPVMARFRRESDEACCCSFRPGRRLSPGGIGIDGSSFLSSMSSEDCVEVEEEI